MSGGVDGRKGGAGGGRRNGVRIVSYLLTSLYNSQRRQFMNVMLLIRQQLAGRARRMVRAVKQFLAREKNKYPNQRCEQLLYYSVVYDIHRICEFVKKEDQAR